MEKQLSYIANRIVIESVMQKENLNTSVDVVHPTPSSCRPVGPPVCQGTLRTHWQTGPWRAPKLPNLSVLLKSRSRVSVRLYERSTHCNNVNW